MDYVCFAPKRGLTRGVLTTSAFDPGCVKTFFRILWTVPYLSHSLLLLQLEFEVGPILLVEVRVDLVRHGIKLFWPPVKNKVGCLIAITT